MLAALAVARPDLLGPDPSTGVVTGLPLGFLAAACYLAYFTALRMGPLSIVSPVIVAYGGLTVVLAVVFRGEQLTGAQAAGAVIATAGRGAGRAHLRDGTAGACRGSWDRGSWRRS